MNPRKKNYEVCFFCGKKITGATFVLLVIQPAIAALNDIF